MQPQPVVRNVLLSNDAVLLGLRSDTMKWECPGGKVEDETLLEAFHRELREETGMTTKSNPVLCGYADVWGELNKDRRYLDLFFFVRTWEGFPQRNEPNTCLAWRWFRFDELPPPNKCTQGTAKFLGGILPSLLQLMQQTAEEGQQDDTYSLSDEEPTPA